MYAERIVGGLLFSLSTNFVKVMTPVAFFQLCSLLSVGVEAHKIAVPCVKRKL
jgi:hypothetical protein